MAKKDKKAKEAKKARSAEKSKKASSKAEVKTKKLATKLGHEDEDDGDIDAILEQFAKDQAAFEQIDVNVCSRPSRRLNPSLAANPLNGKREMVMFGGESVADGTSRFYNDLYSYSVDSDTWRKFTSKNAPLPRSSHAMCSHPSGIFLMFGGEFSLPKQSTFYHYGDTWVLDADTKEWTKADQKNGPLARSGHRMAVWKNYIVMHGGFRDLGTTTTYLNDVWLFDITSYKWTQVEFPAVHQIPDARSGHSLIPCTDGLVLYGGYCKIKAKRGLQKGKVLTDCWILKMKSDPKSIRFERRRKQGFTPSPRVGCSMVFHKNRGILFGGVFDYEESEENLDSEFFNNLYSYQTETNRWYNLALKSSRKRVVAVKEAKTRDEDLENILNSILAKANLNDEEDNQELSDIQKLREREDAQAKDNDDDNVGQTRYIISNQLPHPRFNAITCVIDDDLYIYGGVFERGELEFNLDSMYAIDLGKLDGVRIFWEDLTELEKDELKSDNSDDDDESDSDEEGEQEVAEHEADTRLEAETDDVEPEEDFDDATDDQIPDPCPWLPHPKPFESLRAFYIRTGANFLEWAISSNRDARGKYLKKASFDLCENRFWERREAVGTAEDSLEEMGGVGEVIEKDMSKVTRRR